MKDRAGPGNKLVYQIAVVGGKAMEEQLRQLINLQTIDREIGAIQIRVQEHPKRLAAIDQELQEARERYEAFLGQLEETKKVRRGLEKEIEELEQRIKKSRTKLMEVKNNKEYKAMLTEIDELTKGQRAKEDVLLELMDKAEDLAQQARRRKEELESQLAEGTSRKGALEQSGENAVRELAALEVQRRQAEEGVERQHLEKYEFLRNRLQGLALAEARQGACCVCHMHIPPQMYNELQRNEKLISCPNCFRILYFAGRYEPPKV